MGCSVDRFALLSDVVELAGACIEDLNEHCQFKLFVSNGQPTADFPHIAAYWSGDEVSFDGLECASSIYESFTVSILVGCLKNTGERFSVPDEQIDAEWFLNVYGSVFDCLICSSGNVIRSYARDARGVSVRMGSVDLEPVGGMIGATIHVGFSRMVSCCGGSGLGS